ncbi:TRAP transporter substrate-binding protein DctP [Neptunomonas sp. XY-337]|uniref:TRAP transporter substrate-binding protein DctP n=1 Tax=Neptunomonas sp. XY-337 TaxID=2561897 RepID=UPI0010AB2071|nr:TRAP transporter substrate-binding protein DctP [Neptunomonas sp. XY-337]
MRNSSKRFLKFGAIALTTGVLTLSAAISHAATSIRLSHPAPPGSEQDVWSNEFAKRVTAQTEGRVNVRVYPANQLGDIEEVYELVSQGVIDAAVQSFSTKYDKRLSISWFPYSVSTYAEAESSWNDGGFIFNEVNKLLAPQNITMLAPYAVGMGGMAVGSSVTNPADPDAKHSELKIRVWPSAVGTQGPVLERLGYNITTMPWAELYTGVQTGVIDGMIGGTPENAVRDWNGIVKTWLQINNFFEVNSLFVNSRKFKRLDAEDQQIMRDIAAEMASERFQRVAQADEDYRKQLSDSGVEVVTFSDDEIAAISKAIRADVWPKIKDEIGDELYQKLNAHYSN